MKLWLDDLRPAPDGWHRVLTVTEFKAWMLHYWYDIEAISLDHDLGDVDSENTGYDAITFIEEQVFKNPRLEVPAIYFHTANPVGLQRMTQVLRKLEPYLRDGAYELSE